MVAASDKIGLELFKRHGKVTAGRQPRMRPTAMRHSYPVHELRG